MFMLSARLMNDSASEKGNAIEVVDRVVECYIKVVDHDEKLRGNTKETLDTQAHVRQEGVRTLLTALR